MGNMPSDPQKLVLNPDSLTKEDWQKWRKNLIIFSSPAILAFLMALSGATAHGHLLPTASDLTFAIGAGYSALLASLIDLFGKYKGS